MHFVSNWPHVPASRWPSKRSVCTGMVLAGRSSAVHHLLCGLRMSSPNDLPSGRLS
ncbi:hypothetical protein PF008_g6986 [Phytophthora fragariae]|uniref:Uncharacterized protein n=1 Tax=Phytophthora fragariae TaxID=53985 RepID=A0A6G0S4V7_9STRA|nr:hypothetical protein PF003_g4463 [Phytophthora fragariae]KAE9349244.1 hypothetical protein PF008_g6986 [Phytophthora fragariae]